MSPAASDEEQKKPLLGKRDRTYEEVKAEVFESLEGSRKRLKVFQEETAAIVNNRAAAGEQFKAMMDMYLNRGEQPLEVIGAVGISEEEVQNDTETEQLNEEPEDEEKSHVNSEYPAS